MQLAEYAVEDIGWDLHHEGVVDLEEEGNVSPEVLTYDAHGFVGYDGDS
jgi:hypothetical protein